MNWSTLGPEPCYGFIVEARDVLIGLRKLASQEHCYMLATRIGHMLPQELVDQIFRQLYAMSCIEIEDGWSKWDYTCSQPIKDDQNQARFMLDLKIPSHAKAAALVNVLLS